MEQKKIKYSTEDLMAALTELNFQYKSQIQKNNTPDQKKDNLYVIIYPYNDKIAYKENFVVDTEVHKLYNYFCDHKNVMRIDSENINEDVKKVNIMLDSNQYKKCKLIFIGHGTRKVKSSEIGYYYYNINTKDVTFSNTVIDITKISNILNSLDIKNTTVQIELRSCTQNFIDSETKEEKLPLLITKMIINQDMNVQRFTFFTKPVYVKKNRVTGGHYVQVTKFNHSTNSVNPVQTVTTGKIKIITQEVINALQK